MDWAHKASVFLSRKAIFNPFQRATVMNQEETLERHEVE